MLRKLVAKWSFFEFQLGCERGSSKMRYVAIFFLNPTNLGSRTSKPKMYERRQNTKKIQRAVHVFLLNCAQAFFI